MIDEETTIPVPVTRSAENTRLYALGGVVSFLLKGEVLTTIEQVIALPGGVFHCPARGSEAMPLEAGEVTT